MLHRLSPCLRATVVLVGATPALRAVLATLLLAGLGTGATEMRAAAGSRDQPRALESPVRPRETGAIEGRVLNTATGEYLENAQVAIEGGSRTALTDSLGRFSFGDVPAGPVRLRVFFTGMSPQTVEVTVVAGQTVARDLELAGVAGRAGLADTPVTLSRFVVSTSTEMEGAAIAINEKRFAADIRNVIAADEFGPMADGNAGEILKSVPGVAIDYVGGSAMGISLNGVPSGYVPVTMNGFPLASTTATAPTARDVELVNVATNNLSRIEVLHSPTPEAPGHALGGSVNMVPRAAFDRAKPLLSTNVYVQMRDDVLELGKSPGPGLGRTRKVHPGFDFSYVAPINQRFGFTLSGGTSLQYQPSAFVQTTWRGVSAATNGTTLPATTPGNPYLTDYLVRDFPRQSRRTSGGLTLDFKPGRRDRISVSLQATQFSAQYNQRDLTFSITRVLPGNFSTAFTRGAPGGGTLTLANGNDRDRRNTSLSPSIVYQHRGPVWQAEAGAGWSMSESQIRNAGKGYFANVNANRSNVTIAFEDIFYLRPGRIIVTDAATGAPVDPYRIGTYTLQSASGNAYGDDTVLGVGPGAGIANRTTDVQRSAYANVKREFRWRLPVTLKGGLDLRQSIRDYRGGTTAYTVVGADGRANSADDGAAQVFDPVYSQRDGVFGFPATDRMSGARLWELYRQNPVWFTRNDNTIYRSAIQLSKHAEEVVSSAYLRADASLFGQRLKLSGGVRVEQTNIRAEGPLSDPTRNFRRDANGAIVLGPNGQPQTIVPATDALGVSRLTFIDRGTKAEKEYLRWFPRVHASFPVRENLVARAAYGTAVGRPIYDQYAGGLTLPNVTLPPSPSNRIVVNNVGIKPWTAETVQVSLEYYFEGVGLVSASAFRRDFEDFFGSRVFPATPEFLALYDLDPGEWGIYDVSTQYNVPGKVRMEGFDVQYKQALTFLPAWARGVQVFANGSVQRATGEEADNLANFIPRTASWGLSLTRPRYNVKLNWNYKGRHRRAAVTGQSIEPGTFAWGSKRLFVDIVAEYRLTKQLALFGNIRNLRDTPEDFSREGPSTPDVAKFRQRDQYGALWIFGVKGTF
jgi:iron complex outermembrane receptor protein